MAVDRKITAPFPGATATGSPVDTVLLPLSALSGLTVEHATIATSDWPHFLYSVLETVVAHYRSLDTANKPKACVPSVAIDTRLGDSVIQFPGYRKKVFNITFYLPDVVASSVASEPSA